MDFDEDAVVVDIGSCMIKAGFSSHKTLRAPIYSVLSDSDGTVKIGYDAICDNKNCLRYPIERGVIKNWDDLGIIFDYMYKHELNVNSEELKVLLTEPVMNSNENREKMAEFMFETFHVPSLFLASQGLLSLIASGRTSGVVLDCGDGITQVVPIYDGNILLNSVSQINFAGRDLTEYLAKMINERGYKLKNALESCRCIKEYLCFVSNDSHETTMEKSYELPDKKVITIDIERSKCPEILFKPSLAGFENTPSIHELLFNSIMKCNDFEKRQDLFSNIIISGSTTMLKGFTERIEKELEETIKSSNIKIKIISPPERNKSVWIGGSILASLSSFDKLWFKKSEYEEFGANLLNKRVNFSFKDLINNL